MKFSDWLSGLSADGSPDTGSDYLVSYDASAGASKKVLMDTLVTSSGGITQAGWVAAGETWTYASADDPTFTFTIAGVDLTTKYYPGMRVKLTQSTGGTKYFIITKVAFSTNTTITIYGGTDYNLENEAISDPYYSVVKAPTGFPLSPAKWTVTTTDTTNRSQSTPSAATWYNLGSMSISIPIGVWHVSYSVLAVSIDASATIWGKFTTLSTANNSESDADFTVCSVGNQVLDLYTPHRINKVIELTSKTTYYLNAKTNQSGLDTLTIANGTQKLIIRAICAYL